MSQAVRKAETGGVAPPVVGPTSGSAKPRLSGVAATPWWGRAWVVTLALGLVSTLLYLLLFHYADNLIALAVETRHGHQLYALVPIAIALLFSLVHGAFTGHFWDLLGLKAKGS